MERQNLDLREVLEFLIPAELTYQEWVNVGMGLKESGYSVEDWDQWSSQDTGRYHNNECSKKWNTFSGSANPVTGGTIVQMAMDRGWQPTKGTGRELDWDDVIGAKDELVVIKKNWIEGKDVIAPGEEWSPVQQLITYLEILFESSENVGYVTHSWEKDGRYMPTKGCWDRTAGQLIQLLGHCNGDIGSVLGDYDQAAGAWIRFNPMDGKGIKNENVTDFRFALVESDDMEIDKQNALIRELELPVACLVHSGGKSLHAIVRIDAANYEEYRKRVDYLYSVCQKNGLRLDPQNRNPSRLSRMPGIMRGEQKQHLVDTSIGKASWDEWREWVESVNDDLPEPESMADAWNHLPDLSPSLIDGILRQGHKMLMAGPSKAGKSYALIELCCAVAEGRPWLGFPCTRGRILYVNLELDRASCLHRFKDVYTALEWSPDHLANIDIWNLRGKSVPMDKLAPKLIRRATKKDYIAIVIDPIYKVITGDENSADQMAHFCNQFDKVCTELGCAVIYCHHHSKGSQGSKRSMDRASGSGVFARDPDALLDLIELEPTEALLKQEENKAVCAVCLAALCRAGLEEQVSQDDACSQHVMLASCKKLLTAAQYNQVQEDVLTAQKAVESRTAWRVEGTLREFPKFHPINMWFDYPIHRVDISGGLKDVEPEGERPTWKKAFEKKKNPEERDVSRKDSMETAFGACTINGDVTVAALMEYMGKTRNTVKNYIKDHGGFLIEDGIVKRVSTVSKVSKTRVLTVDKMVKEGVKNRVSKAPLKRGLLTAPILTAPPSDARRREGTQK